MKFPIKISQKNTLTVYWIITDLCNFSCNYCPEFLHSGLVANGKVPRFPTKDEIFFFIDKLEEIVKQNNLTLQIQFGGGEPVLHPNLPEIINRLKEFTPFIGITTNGSRSLSWWEEILPLYNVSISLHHEFTNIDKINNLGLHILENKLASLMFNLSCDPKFWKETLALYKSLDNDLKKYVSPKVLNYLGEKIKRNFDYSEDQIEKIKHLDSLTKFSAPYIKPPSEQFIHFNDGTIEKFSLAKLTVNKWNSFKDWNCWVGKECISINFKGEIYSGVCKVKSLGTLTNFSLYDEPVACPFNFCVCPGDMRSQKEKKL